MNNIENVFCSLDVGAVSLSLNDLLKLKLNDTLVCRDMQLPFEGALRVNGSVWAYVTIDHQVDGGMSVMIKKLAANSETQKC